MPRLLAKLIDKLGRARWLAVPVGGVIALLSAFAFWFLFQLKDYSSAIRDNLEQPPGLAEYVIFGVACAIFVAAFWVGVCCIVLGARRRHGA